MRKCMWCFLTLPEAAVPAVSQLFHRLVPTTIQASSFNVALSPLVSPSDFFVTALSSELKGLADHKDSLGAPLCHCRHYDDKAAEVAQGFWNCPCAPISERKESHCMLFLTPENNFEQVVKRGRTSTEYSQSRSNVEPLPGNKRSFVDRSAYVGDNQFFSKKRQRGNDMSFNGRNGFKDKKFGVEQNDLRLKLMHKSQSKKILGNVEERRRIDLRQQLSRNVQPSGTPSLSQQRRESKDNNYFRQLRPRESADDLYLVHSFRKPSSSYVDGLRARSPDEFLKTFRGRSLPRYFDPSRRVTSTRATDSARGGWFLRNNVDPRYSTVSRPLKMAAFSETGKSVERVVQTSGSNAKRPFLGEESLNVSSLLHSLGLGKYAIHFQAEEIDMAALKQMGDKDLKELGIPMGPRKKILLALLPRFRR